MDFNFFPRFGPTPEPGMEQARGLRLSATGLARVKEILEDKDQIVTEEAIFDEAITVSDHMHTRYARND